MPMCTNPRSVHVRWTPTLAHGRTIHRVVCMCTCACACACVCVSCVQDKLLRHLRRMRMVYGPVYDFFPPSYILPRERAAFEAEMAAQTEQVHGDG